MSVLGDNLKKRRLELDISQAEMAKIVNKAPETYCRYEAGTLKPDIDTLLLIADALQITIDELTGRDLRLIAQALFMAGKRAGEQTADTIANTIIRKRASKRKKEQSSTPKDKA